MSLVLKSREKESELNYKSLSKLFIYFIWLLKQLIVKYLK